MERPAWSQLGLHVIAKPIGPICNLRCAYCFYLKKENLYPKGEQWKMPDETVEAYVRQYIEAQPEVVEEIDFAFQGGEPTLMGLEFFRRVVELQKQHTPPGKRIHNSLQTNGVLLDDEWCAFLREHNFLVGLSIDGPVNLHNKYRRDAQGRGTFDQVTRAMRRLFRHGVEFNALVCVSRANGDHPLRVYRFLRDAGIQFIQFIPIVEPLGDVPAEGGPADAKRDATSESKPEAKPESKPDAKSQSKPDAKSQSKPEARPESLVSPRSVLPRQFGRFLIGVFDEWVERDVGRVFVRDFDQALAAWTGVGASLCVYTKECGRATAIEHNGDLYSCDHFVDPEHKLGNIHEAPIAELANLPRQEQFGRDKWEKLPGCCRRCDVLFACHGACPKDRFLRSPDGEPGLNYLCEGYRTFFGHVDPYMKFMADELRAGRPAAGIMHRLRAERQRAREEGSGDGRRVRRNDPCPCGSGKKFKNCCMQR
jgi:uncharacterized protein